MADVEVTVLVWDEHNVAHIARHAVVPTEVADVVFGAGTRWAQDDSHRSGRMVAAGPTAAGRLLIVVCEPLSPAGSTTA